MPGFILIIITIILHVLRIGFHLRLVFGDFQPVQIHSTYPYQQPLRVEQSILLQVSTVTRKSQISRLEDYGCTGRQFYIHWIGRWTIKKGLHWNPIRCIIITNYWSTILGSVSVSDHCNHLIWFYITLCHCNRRGSHLYVIVNSDAQQQQRWTDNSRCAAGACCWCFRSVSPLLVKEQWF